jgi:hypothetical protein
MSLPAPEQPFAGAEDQLNAGGKPAFVTSTQKTVVPITDINQFKLNQRPDT